ncbi:MAG: hypothetical protein HYY17_06475 [Planctomycetes bacterium]|nr:hypothetical protein [Planctomycetota bacterium]
MTERKMMRRWTTIRMTAIAATLLLVAGGCRKKPEAAPPGRSPEKKSVGTAAEVIVIRVDGMQRGDGGKT